MGSYGAGGKGLRLVFIGQIFYILSLSSLGLACWV